MLLAGDIGGTKTALAIFGDDYCNPIHMKIFPSNRYQSLEAVIDEFLEEVNVHDINRACFGVAGPVIGGVSKLTNLSWLVDEQKLRHHLKTSDVFVINDLKSIASSVPYLPAENMLTLNPGNAEPKGSLAVIAPGTGLGMGYLTWDGKRYLPYPSQGGHIDLSPRTNLEQELLRFLHQDYNQVSFEMVCSGIGLPMIFKFLTSIGEMHLETWVQEELAQAEDWTPVIVQAALKETNSCSRCRLTLDLFISFLATATSSLALTVLSTGGVYLGGGIALALRDRLSQDSFIKMFTQNTKMSALLQNMPVKIINHPHSGLIGSACFAMFLADSY